jgi:hypothetical protein
LNNQVNIKQVKARQPNWLPLPQPLNIDLPEISVSRDDMFPKGEITSFYQNLGIGKIVDTVGREIPFDLKELYLVGPKNRKDYIKIGGKVGFDISRSGKGLRIITMKVYESSFVVRISCFIIEKSKNKRRTTNYERRILAQVSFKVTILLKTGFPFSESAGSTKKYPNLSN